MMRKTAFLLLLTASVYSPLSHAQITDDAIFLTLGAQDGIPLDTTTAMLIDSGLSAARAEIDTLQSIHIYKPYRYDWVTINVNAAWDTAWRQGQVLTGEPYIDSLSLQYGLKEITNTSSFGFIYLLFAEPVEVYRLSDLYAQHPEVIWAEPNGRFGEGDTIDYFRKNNLLHFAFSKGWGDCPAGCGERHYWYVTVALNDTGPVVRLEEDVRLWTLASGLYRWNIPDYYVTIGFENAGAILDSITMSSVWWVRRHAVEGTWRLMTLPSPRLHFENNEHWYALQSALQSRKSDVLAALQIATDDTDADVRASAKFAISQIIITSVEDIATPPSVFQVHPNYPNPFNLTTTIRYELRNPAHVKIVVYDVRGRRVRELVNGRQATGIYTVRWDGKNQSGMPVSTGVYFLSTRAGGLVTTQRMILLK